MSHDTVIRLYTSGLDAPPGAASTGSRQIAQLTDVLLKVRRGQSVEPRFEKLARFLSEQTTDVDSAEQSDVVIFAGGPTQSDVALHADVARRAGKAILFFDGSDSSAPSELTYGTLYRTSLDRSRARPWERSMPALCADLRTELPSLHEPRPCNAVPSVGFVGFVGTPLQRLAYRLTGRRDKVVGLAIRERLLASLEAQSAGRIRCQFTRRDTFQGARRDDPKQQQSARTDFLINLAESDYAVCVRGKGNYSFRFYEALSAGRIPLWLDTDSVLPFEDELKWDQLLVRVDESELPRIVDRLVQWHQRHATADAFIAAQATVRTVWESHLEPSAFFRRILHAHRSGPTDH